MVSTGCSQTDNNSSLQAQTQTAMFYWASSKPPGGMLREDRAKMIPLPDASHGPRFFTFPQSQSSPGLNRSLLRHPMRTDQISPARWQSGHWLGCSGFPVVKTAFQKAVFSFLRDGSSLKILVSDACLQSFRGTLSSRRFYL